MCQKITTRIVYGCEHITYHEGMVWHSNARYGTSYPAEPTILAYKGCGNCGEVVHWDYQTFDTSHGPGLEWCVDCSEDLTDDQLDEIRSVHSEEAAEMDRVFEELTGPDLPARMAFSSD